MLDWSAIGHEAAEGAVVIDTRNLLDTKIIQDAQLSYLGNGTRAGLLIGPDPVGGKLHVTFHRHRVVSLSSF
jgi:hypothetical protein